MHSDQQARYDHRFTRAKARRQARRLSHLHGYPLEAGRVPLLHDSCLRSGSVGVTGASPFQAGAGATTMIKKLPSDIPRTPGVYFFSAGGGPASGGKIIYIGKALNLHNRLHGHPMLEKADKIDWQEVGSEIEALILESQYIKKYKPLYNIALRDDKNYVYVQITDEEFPKIFVAHRNGIGPFTSSTELRAALKAIRKLIPYCTCKQKHNRLCLNAHIGKCIGICCLKNPKHETLNTKQIIKTYKKNIQIIKDIFSGKQQALKKFPRVFENIKVIKEISGRENALAKLMKLFKLTKLPTRIECYDISNIQGKFATGSMIVFENGYPNKGEYRKFKIRAPASPDDIKMLGEMLERRFAHTEWPKPDLLLIDGGIAQMNVAKKALELYSYKAIQLLSIAKGKQEIFSSTLPVPVAINKLSTDVKNMILHLDAEAHRFAISYYRRLHKKSISGSLKQHD